MVTFPDVFWVALPNQLEGLIITCLHLAWNHILLAKNILDPLGIFAWFKY